MPNILAKLVELAEEGDITAIRLVMDRMLPAVSAQAEALQEELDALTERLERLTEKKAA